MTIRYLIVSIILSLSFASPAALADEMGTGNPEPSTSQSTSAASMPAAAESEDFCSLWETFLSWFE